MPLIKKLWGDEDWLYNGPAGYCMKVLHINVGYQSSLHYHKNKHETFLVISGECDIEVDTVPRRMVRGDYQVISPGTLHLFRSVNGSCVVVEASTHHDEEDVIRVQPSKEIE